MDSDSPHYLIVIYGPPATGKTTLAQRILDSYRKQNLNQSVLMLSTDSCEEYLRTHSIAQLSSLLSSPMGWIELANYKVQRALFDEKLWKNSRQFVRQSVSEWAKERAFVIIQDDLLLKSQRKQIRQAIEGSKVHYIEVYPKASFEECLLSLSNRNSKLTKQEQLSAQALKDCFQKFEKDSNCYTLELERASQLSWVILKERAKPVVIQHPELKPKQEVSQENSQKDEVENKIRAYISEIMGNELLRARYFKDRPLKEVAKVLVKIKKGYSSRQKSLEGFLAYLETETSQ